MGKMVYSSNHMERYKRDIRMKYGYTSFQTSDNIVYILLYSKRGLMERILVPPDKLLQIPEVNRIF